MVFTIGKYKGWEIKDVIKENPDYCIWFLENISGNDYFKNCLLNLLKKTVENDFIENNDFTKIESEIILALQKNGRSEFEAKSILSIYQKQLKK